MHETFTYLRANDPVYRDPTTGMVGVTRHADIVDVERRAQVFVSSQGYRSMWSPQEDNMIAQDDPGTPSSERSSPAGSRREGDPREEPLIRAVVDELLDAIADRGEIEVVDELAAQYPSRLTCDLLGFPPDRWRDLKSWSERMMRIDSLTRDGSGQVFQDLMAAIMEFQAFLDVAVPRFRAEPDRSFISVWANATVKGCPMNDHTIMNETGLFISGGAETYAHGDRSGPTGVL